MQNRLSVLSVISAIPCAVSNRLFCDRVYSNLPGISVLCRCHEEEPLRELYCSTYQYAFWFLKEAGPNMLNAVPPKEIEALKAAVNVELRRVEQLEG